MRRLSSPEQSRMVSRLRQVNYSGITNLGLGRNMGATECEQCDLSLLQPINRKPPRQVSSEV